MLIRLLLFFAFLIYCLIFLFPPTVTLASTNQQQTNRSSQGSESTLSAQPNFQYTENVVASLVHTTSCLIAGVSLLQQPCFGYPALPGFGIIDGQNSGRPEGAIGFTTSFISSLYTNPPLRTANYLASITDNFIPKPAYAQVGGSGSQIVAGVLTLWQVTRNITYVIMTMVFMIIGLMVMFKQKLNPQVVITAQLALPGLVIGLILITFSYLLASFLVDLSFVGTWVVGYYFAQTQPVKDNLAGGIIQNYNALQIFGMFSNAGNTVDFGAAIAPTINTIQGTAGNIISWTAFFLGCQYGTQLAGPVGQINIATIPVGGIISLGACLSAGGAAKANPAWAIGWAVAILFLFIMLSAMLNLFLRLINNYVMILILTFTAPFHFLAASLPGQQDIAITWLKNMLCNVLSFPAVFAGFYFAAYILGSGSFDPSYPPFGITNRLQIPQNTLPLLGGLSENLVRFLLAFGVLTTLPAIPLAICEAIGKIGRSGQLLGEEVQNSIRGGQGHFGRASGAVGGAFGSLGAGFRSVGQAGGQSPKTPGGPTGGGPPVTPP